MGTVKHGSALRMNSSYSSRLLVADGVRNSLFTMKQVLFWLCFGQFLQEQYGRFAITVGKAGAGRVAQEYTPWSQTIA